MKLWRHHPVTGQDAEVYMDERLLLMPLKERGEIAQMRNNNARFYWEKSFPESSDTVQGYNLCEYGNVKFVADVMGEPLEII